MRASRWMWLALCGLASTGMTGPLHAAEPVKPPDPKPAKGAPVWQMVISPRCGAPVVADFYGEPDGSLTVQHRLIRSGERIGGPEAGEVAPPPRELAPPIAPAPAAGPAPELIPPPKTDSRVPRKDRRTTVRLIGQESELDEGRRPPFRLAQEFGKPPAGPELPERPEAKPPVEGSTPPAVDAPLAAAGAADWWGHGRPSYVDVYFSIPFFRSEYDANPSYRHEATMEILFGQLRPMTTQKIVAPPIVHRTDAYNLGEVTPFSYWNGRGYTNYHIYYQRPAQYRPMWPN